MKKVVILQSNYIPWKGYFDLVHHADLFIFYDEVKYTKNSWRNRNRIYTLKDIQWMTIPIYKDAVKQKISEVRLKDSKWQKLHFSFISSGYEKAKYFFQMEELLSQIYLNKQWEYLSEMNQYTIKKISALIDIQTKFSDSKEYILDGGRVEKMVTLLKQVNATEYITGPSAKKYLADSEHLFSDNNIKLIYKTYPEYPSYNQLSKPFINEVSILDLIANIKIEDIKNYIWSFRLENDKD